MIVAPLPWAPIPWLWCTCLGMRAMLLDVRAAQWVCLRCGAQVEYGKGWGV